MSVAPSEALNPTSHGTLERTVAIPSSMLTEQCLRTLARTQVSAPVARFGVTQSEMPTNAETRASDSEHFVLDTPPRVTTHPPLVTLYVPIIGDRRSDMCDV